MKYLEDSNFRLQNYSKKKKFPRNFRISKFQIFDLEIARV